jgi:hypothetical protein
MRRTKRIIALERKLSHDKAAILNSAEVAALARQVRRVVGPLIADLPSAASVQIEDGVRWAAVRTCCQQARAQRGLSLKHVAVGLHLPQYRLKAIEHGAWAEFKADIAHRYFKYLGIDSWVAQWSQANPGLARRIGLFKVGARQRWKKRIATNAV